MKQLASAQSTKRIGLSHTRWKKRILYRVSKTRVDFSKNYLFFGVCFAPFLFSSQIKALTDKAPATERFVMNLLSAGAMLKNTCHFSRSNEF